MIHLRAVAIHPFKEIRFPFNLPILQNLTELNFNTPVTFLVGENGTGKYLASQHELSKYFRLAWSMRTKKGFFLRAEDFFGYAKRLNLMRAEIEEDLHEIDGEYESRSGYAKSLAKMSTSGQLNDLQRRSGDGLDA